jgi:hypothetical protein
LPNAATIDVALRGSAIERCGLVGTALKWEAEGGYVLVDVLPTGGGDAQIDRLIDIMHALEGPRTARVGSTEGILVLAIGPPVITAMAFPFAFPIRIIYHTKPKLDGAPPSPHFQPR